MSFFQFLASNWGSQLTEIFTLGGQPNPLEWEHHENRWIQSRMEWNEKEKLDDNSPDWAIRTIWKSKSFMHEYWQLVNGLSKNPFILTQEDIIWSCHHLAQVKQSVVS